MQALGDRGRFNQVTSTQVAGDEMVKVSDQVLPSRTGHVWKAFPVFANSETPNRRWKISPSSFRRLRRPFTRVRKGRLFQLQILPAALQMFVDELCVKSTVSRVVPTRYLHHPQLIWDTRSYCVKSCSILEFCSQSLFRNNSHWYFIPSSMNHITPNEQKIQKARPDDVILFQAQNSHRADVTSSSLTLVKWPF